MSRLLPRMPKGRWKRLFLWLGLFAGAALGALLMLVALGWWFFHSPHRRAWVFQQLMWSQMHAFPKEAPRAALEGPERPEPPPTATEGMSSADLFRVDRIWEVHLGFGSNEWRALAPRKVRPLPMEFDADHVTLNNTNASNPGVLGVLGFELPWSTAAEVEIGGVRFTNVAARHKGNGTYLDGMQGYKRSFKLQLDRGYPGRTLAAQRVLNVHNLAADRSFLSEALAYEYFREAGVPASRTSYADVRLSIGGVLDRRRLGLFSVVENPDGAWLRERFGTGDVLLLKPVTVDLFGDLGPSWDAYVRTYDPRGEPSPAQQERFLRLVRLVSGADDAAFAAQIGDHLDLDAAARFFATEVLLSNYDGILATGQNFLVYLDPRRDRFGFAPWDLDHSWGEFPLVGTTEERETADIWRPWVRPQPFLARLFEAEGFLTRYRSELERQLEELFIPERLERRVDELAAVIRAWVHAETADRAAAFEMAVGEPAPPTGMGQPPGPGSTHQLKRFIRARATSVRRQLAGEEQGARPERRRPF